MGRTARDRTKRPYLPPVNRIELPSRYSGWRLVAAILFLLIGAAALAYGLSSLFGAEAGWTEIEAEAGDYSCAEDFVLSYELGVAGRSAAAERRALTAVYTQAAREAYRWFTNDQTFEGVHNVRYLNEHPNETVAVDEALYQAFELLEEQGSRALYLAPVYEIYDNIFYCADNNGTVDFDPRQDEVVRAFFEGVAAFANDPESVRVELLDDQQVRLYVSEAYLAYADDESITDFIDFYWLKNAFIADYLADTLKQNGFVYGTISSLDGFARALDPRGTVFGYNLFDRGDNGAQTAAVMQYSGARSIVGLRSFPISSGESWRYRQLDNGDIRTTYLDVQDGLDKTALDSLVTYSSEMGCAELLLRTMPCYIADEWDAMKLQSLKASRAEALYCLDGAICHTDETLTLSNAAEGYTIINIIPQ